MLSCVNIVGENSVVLLFYARLYILTDKFQWHFGFPGEECGRKIKGEWERQWLKQPVACHTFSNCFVSALSKSRYNENKHI